MREEKSISQISSEYSVHPTQLQKWKRQALAGLPDLFLSESKGKSDEIKKLETEQECLYAEIGRLTTQLNWLKRRF